MRKERGDTLHKLGKLKGQSALLMAPPAAYFDLSFIVYWCIGFNTSTFDFAGNLLRATFLSQVIVQVFSEKPPITREAGN